MKKRLYLLLMTLSLSISLAGCGSGSTSTSDSINSMYTGGFGVSDMEYSKEYAEEYSDSIDMDIEAEIDTNIDGENDIVQADNQSKLVYESNISIDTLEFDKACAEFESLIDEFNGFVETQRITDDGSRSVYIYNDADKVHHTLNATVRIPSKNYESFMSKTSGLGDVRSSEETVKNMTQTYGTLQAQLEIYETEYDSYMTMLSEVNDESTRLEIRENLTEISVYIATIKSQMSTIDTDVTYSTIHIEINEVEEYQEEKDTSTFTSRLKNTFETSFEELLEFLEDLLFAIILNWYRVLFMVLVIIGIVKFVKWMDKRSRKKKDVKNHNTFVSAAPVVSEEKDVEHE